MIDILSFVIFFFIVCSFYIISSLGLNIQYGFTGMFNVGIAGFFAVGAYTSAILTGPTYADTIFGGFGLPIISRMGLRNYCFWNSWIVGWINHFEIARRFSRNFNFWNRYQSSIGSTQR